MTTLPIKKSMRRSFLRLAFFLIPVALTLFALPQIAQAEDGSVGSAGSQNTAEGTGALQNLASNGVRNTAVGFDALLSNTGGGANTAIGAAALASNTANNNTACGSYALNANTTGDGNTATGIDALMLNTSGGSNTANGASALFSNTTGSNNTAYGFGALSNTTGSDNTALGFQALQSNKSNSTGEPNTAVGSQSLFTNTTGWGNTATGFQALYGNTIGTRNTANGEAALGNNTTGSNNTATGFEALFDNTTGSRNVATGLGALLFNTTGGHNIAYGNSALSGSATGKYNIGLGYSAGWNLTTGNNNIDIGNPGVASESNTIRIGSEVTSGLADGSTQPVHKATFIAGIHGVTVASAVGVVVDVNGHLGTVTSSARFKEAIKPMDRASEAVLALQPVTFRYKHALDPDGIPQFGLVAEQVEKVNPDLVVRDQDGKINTVRYEAVNAMLLNEFLKEHRKVEEQQATITRLESKVAKQEVTATQQQKQIEALTAAVQKVSHQVALSKPAPKLVANP